MGGLNNGNLTDHVLACANIVCAQCTDLGQSRINNCCSQAVPLQCFIAGAGGNTQTNPYLTTLAPDPNFDVCSTALDYITQCESLTSGFSDLANSDEASCLCYDSTSWDPNGFDVPWSSCIAWAKTANSTVYPDLLTNAGMCSSVGNILHAPASGAASTTGGTSTPTTATPVKATPVGGSGGSTTPTATANATPTSTAIATATPKTTSASVASGLSRNIEAIIVTQVRGLERLMF
jgi:hypothetical protein